MSNVCDLCTMVDLIDVETSPLKLCCLNSCLSRPVSVGRACLLSQRPGLTPLCRLFQESVQSARLVQLFDPVTSPRCYALIATKRPDTAAGGQQAA